MALEHYSYTLERLNKLIYILTVDKGNIKERLIKSLIWWTSENAFPKELRELYREIDNVITTKKSDEYQSTYERSLQNIHLKKCSLIADKIVTLELMLEQYIRNYEEG